MPALPGLQLPIPFNSLLDLARRSIDAIMHNNLETAPDITGGEVAVLGQQNRQLHGHANSNKQPQPNYFRPRPASQASLREHYRRQISELRSHVDRLENKLHLSQGRNQELVELIQQERAEAGAQSTHFQQLLWGKDNTIAALRKREVELQAAHEFLTSEDKCSAADVKALVVALNYEILQVSSTIAQYSWEKINEDEGDELTGDQMKGVIQRVVGIIGVRFCKALGVWNHTEDTTLLQLAFQAVLCSHCHRLILSWDECTFRNLSSYFTSVYKEMSKNEPQPVFARWRSLTQRQMNAILEQHDLEPLENVFLGPIRDVVSASGIGVYADLSETLDPFLIDKLRALKPHIHRINKAIRLEFISADLTPTFIRSGAKFNNKTMRNADEPGDEGETVQDRVVCTTELGLQMVKKVTKHGESHNESRLLLEPQVFLQSSFEELMLDASNSRS